MHTEIESWFKRDQRERECVCAHKASVERVSILLRNDEEILLEEFRVYENKGEL